LHEIDLASTYGANHGCKSEQFREDLREFDSPYPGVESSGFSGGPCGGKSPVDTVKVLLQDPGVTAHPQERD